MVVVPLSPTMSLSFPIDAYAINVANLWVRVSERVGVRGRERVGVRVRVRPLECSVAID